MNEHEDFRLSLGSYLVGALDPAERAELEAHLRGCRVCRDELSYLSVIPGLLGRLSSEEFANGQPPVPETLLPGLLERARVADLAAHRRLRRWRGATAALTLVAASVLGVVALRALSTSSPSGPTYALRATVAATHLSGDVTLVPKTWGTAMALSVSGLPAGVSCVAVLEGSHGRIEDVGFWGPTPTHDVQVQLASDMTTSTLSRLTIETIAGRSLLTTPLARA